MFRKTLALVLIAALAFAGVSYGAENLGFPGKNHSGEIGKSSRVWNKVYMDYLYIYGGSSYYGTPAATLTGNRTWTFPDATSTVNVNCTVTHNYAANSADWTLTAAEAACSMLYATNASAAVNAYIPVEYLIPGKTYVVFNGSGQTLTFKAVAASGDTVANGKSALYYTSTADVLEAKEQ